DAGGDQSERLRNSECLHGRRQSRRGVLQRLRPLQHVPFPSGRSERCRVPLPARAVAGSFPVSSRRPGRPIETLHRYGYTAQRRGSFRHARIHGRFHGRAAGRRRLFPLVPARPDQSRCRRSAGRARATAAPVHRQTTARRAHILGDAQMRRPIFAALLLTGALAAQPLNPAKLLQPPTDAWPTYNGDYTGRRFSPLKQINQSNVNALNLAWARRFTAGGRGGVQIKATPLEVNGILYFAAPDNAWAVDARSGRELWHFTWETTGGLHIGNRGLGMYGDWLFFETPDCYLISLDAKTGKMRWNRQIAEVKREYFCWAAPFVIRNHVLVGVGGDSLDVPGYLESRDPETGQVQWRWNTTPRPGEPGAETWPSKESMEHGGGMTWHPGTDDPDLNLYYLGTGNPNPVYAPQS